MEASSSRSKPHGSSCHHHFQRSTSPSGRFCSYSMSSTSPSFSSFSNRDSDFMTRSTSPTRVNLRRSVSPSPNVRFSASAGRSMSVYPHQPKQNSRPLASNQKKTCMCSPTTHPGSFRCSLHKNMSQNRGHSNSSYRSNYHLNMRRSAMTNSLVRIGTVEVDGTQLEPKTRCNCIDLMPFCLPVWRFDFYFGIWLPVHDSDFLAN
ncbi:hypothetical protein HAX54_030913 [Datura stramonium]|uniref:Serine-rich protein-like protein n=1 Tax=Datura stramonium TaxID=4076 RepID=A0ABS8V8D9_DATST|nr:hypothetical protein [Datura stramonium]